jgi:archaellum biogenesis ATPase FlaH
MTRFNWFAREMASQILRVQVPNGALFDQLFDAPFLKYTSSSELISVDSVHSGMLTELTYSIGMKKSNQIQEFLSEIKNLNGNNKVTLIAGYNNTDL